MASTTLTLFGLDFSRLTARFSSLRRKVARGQLLLEFDVGVIRYALGTLRDGNLKLSCVGRVDLPEEALERGVPTDPEQMAGLIRELCQEHSLYTHQVSVVLPSDAALLRVVELPAELSLEQAREQLLDPQSGSQLPIPLTQTDFDLVRCHLPLRRTADKTLLRSYLLVAVPQELTGKVLTTMELAELFLQRLELAPLAAMRLKQQEFRSLRRGEFDLWLELLPGRSVCTVVADSGPVAQYTLVAVREFPEPVLSPEDMQMAFKEGFLGEDMTVRDPVYLPLSELDLRVLVSEIQELRSSFAGGLPECRWSTLWLSGLNSAHPLLEELLQEQLDCSVHRVDPIAETQEVKVDYAQLLIRAGLSRLLGLALGLFPNQMQSLGSTDDDAWEVDGESSLAVEPTLVSDVVSVNAELVVEELELSENSVQIELPDPDPDPDVEFHVAEADEPPIAAIAYEALDNLDPLDLEPLALDSSQIMDGTDSSTSDDLADTSDLDQSAWPTIHTDSAQPLSAEEPEWPTIKQDFEAQTTEQSPDLSVSRYGEDDQDNQSNQGEKKAEMQEDSGSLSFGELRFSDDG